VTTTDGLTASDIAEVFDKLNQELARKGTHATMTVIGGAYMAHLGERESTVDIDAATAIAPELAEAARTVLAQLGLPMTTINSNSKTFVSAADIQTDRIVLHAGSNLTVFGPSADTMLLLKLRASRPLRDEYDIRNLWKRTTFRSAHDVIEAFRDAFPEEPDDEYLEDHVDGLARRAGHNFAGPPE